MVMSSTTSIAMAWTIEGLIFVWLLLLRTPGTHAGARIVPATKASGMLRTRAGFELQFGTTTSESISAISILPGKLLWPTMRPQRDIMENSRCLTLIHDPTLKAARKYHKEFAVLNFE